MCKQTGVTIPHTHTDKIEKYLIHGGFCGSTLIDNSGALLDYCLHVLVTVDETCTACPLGAKFSSTWIPGSQVLDPWEEGRIAARSDGLITEKQMVVWTALYCCMLSYHSPEVRDWGRH
jgi:hypothetical protein